MSPVSGSGDLLLISPPFAGIERPALGLHILQQIAHKNRLKCEIYYANIALAAIIGEAEYVAVAYSPPLNLLGERLFSSHAFPSTDFTDDLYNLSRDPLRASQERQVVPDLSGLLPAIEATIGDWLNGEFRRIIRSSDFTAFGLTSMFAQNLACVALARVIKQERPDSLVIIGGANCDGGMAEGISALSDEFDHIFVGESEETFGLFCRQLVRGERPFGKFVRGSPTLDLDSLACPDFETYFSQLKSALPDSKLIASDQVFLSYETSRGCWWGQKSHCTFCGLNANGMGFRKKSADKVIFDLVKLRATHGKIRIAMTDNIMPITYFDDLMPELARLDLDMDLFYEQKSNLKFSQLQILKRAGVNTIQPGIEALSSALLRRMRKGVSAAQNIRLLRDCRRLNIEVIWNLLCGFPGEGRTEYEDTLRLLKHLRHLSPPNGFSTVSFDRFSPYFDQAASFRINRLRPHPNYFKIYPPTIPISDVAYHFVGEADVLSLRDPWLSDAIRQEVQTWIELWRGEQRPVLCITPLTVDEFLVTDTREPNAISVETVGAELAAVISSDNRGDRPGVLLAAERGWVVEVDQLFIGLAITEVAISADEAPSGHRHALQGDVAKFSL